jgi:hypothetical protein
MLSFTFIQMKHNKLALYPVLSVHIKTEENV